MFRKIAAFELRYQLTSPVFWVAFGIFFILSFAAMTNDNVHIGGEGNTLYNAPFAIIRMLAVMSFFVLFAGTAFVANVIVRDDETGFGPIIRSAPVGRFNYLFGRFAGAFGAVALVFAAVPLGVFLGTLMPWVDQLKLGPFRPQDYLYAYFFISLPTLLVLSATFFALATATRSMMATYLGVVGFLVLYIVFSQFVSKPEYEHVAALTEPFGFGALHEVTKYWTAAERNTQLPPLGGVILFNRLIWFAVALVMLAAAYAAFKPGEKGRKATKIRKADTTEALPSAGPLPAPHFEAASRLRQAWKWTRFEMALVFKSPAFFVLLAIGLFNAGGGMWYADDVAGFTVYPVSRLMISVLTGAFTIIPIIIAIFYAGELVWRERDRRTHEMIDATPLPDWAFVMPKLAAIVLVLVATFLISVVAAVFIQTGKGYTTYEIGHYLTWYVLPLSVAAVQIAALSVFVQVLSPHKYVGWAIMAVYIVASIYLPSMGYENNLYVYGGSPGMPLSDMNGAGKFWIGDAWFNVYWTAFALILMVLTYALWRRGSETRYKPRFARLPRRLSGAAGGVLAAAGLIFAGAGAWCFYNTSVLNEYRASSDQEKFLADFEKTLLPFEKVPQPRIVAVKLNVALHPHAPRAETEGSYTIENRTNTPLDKMHVSWNPDLDMQSLSVEGARPVKDYGRMHYRIFAFSSPMRPGERRTVSFRTVMEQKGFKNGDDMTRIVDNGTFVSNMEIAPFLGVSRAIMLSDPVKRRRHGLPSTLRPPKLEDDAARADNYLRHDSDWVTSDITVSTVADQVPIAPGYQVSQVVKDGRRTVRFASDSPIMNFFSIQSADYRIKHAKWRNVDLAVYYDAHHPYEIDRMLAAMKTSLDVYADAFSPFQFRQMRILEFPTYATFAQSFAGTVPFSEGIGFIQNFDAIKDDPDKIDMVTYVTAHELGHQWWAHQVIGADMQGMTLLSESFAQYSAMLVMEKLYGPEHVRKFLKHELDGYLRARGTEEIEEVPLNRVEDQGYIHYHKGALAMYRLKQAVGEETVNRALRRLLKTYAFKPAPYPKSTDFLKILREEAGPRYDTLIADLFERITLYDLRTLSSSAVKRRDGKWDVTLTVSARKYYADGTGKEREAPLNEAIDVGAFLSEPGKKGFEKSKILSFVRLPVKSGEQKLHLVTGAKPAFVGIDPYNEWIDRNSNDNVKPL